MNYSDPKELRRQKSPAPPTQSQPSTHPSSLAGSSNHSRASSMTKSISSERRRPLPTPPPVHGATSSNHAGPSTCALPDHIRSISASIPRQNQPTTATTVPNGRHDRNASASTANTPKPDYPVDLAQYIGNKGSVVPLKGSANLSAQPPKYVSSVVPSLQAPRPQQNAVEKPHKPRQDQPIINNQANHKNAGNQSKDIVVDNAPSQKPVAQDRIQDTNPRKAIVPHSIPITASPKSTIDTQSTIPFQNIAPRKPNSGTPLRINTEVPSIIESRRPKAAKPLVGPLSHRKIQSTGDIVAPAPARVQTRVPDPGPTHVRSSMSIDDQEKRTRMGKARAKLFKGVNKLALTKRDGKSDTYP